MILVLSILIFIQVCVLLGGAYVLFNGESFSREDITIWLLILIIDTAWLCINVHSLLSRI